MLWMTSWPSDLVLTRSMKSRATLKFTSASRSAMRTSRSESPMFSSEIFPRPRRFRNAFWSLLLSVSNIGLNYAGEVEDQRQLRRALGTYRQKLDIFAQILGRVNAELRRAASLGLRCVCADCPKE